MKYNSQELIDADYTKNALDLRISRNYIIKLCHAMHNILKCIHCNALTRSLTLSAHVCDFMKVDDETETE